MRISANCGLSAFILASVFMLSDSAATADDDPVGMRVGKRATVSGVAFASGEWRKTRSYLCPAAARGREPKIAIYTDTLDDNVLKLAVAVEARIQADEKLKWSFVEMLDEKGARGSDAYSREELQQRLKELRQLAKRNSIERLTFGVSGRAGGEERERLGMPAKTNVLIAFIHGRANQSRQVRFVRHVHSSKLNQAAIKAVLLEIDAIYRNR